MAVEELKAMMIHANRSRTREPLVLASHLLGSHLAFHSSSNLRDRLASGRLEFLVAPCCDSDHDQQADMTENHNISSLGHERRTLKSTRNLEATEVFLANGAGRKPPRFLRSDTKCARQ
jgi:hypothetical protein